MRLRTVTALIILVAVSAAGCSGTPNGAAPTKAAPTEAAPTAASATAAPPGSKDEICRVWIRKAFGDPGEPAVRHFGNLVSNPAQYPVPQRIAIRKAFYALQEREIRSLAALATDAPLQAALRRFADGWAALGRDTSADGPPIVVPDMTAVRKACGGRTVGVPTQR